MESDGDNDEKPQNQIVKTITPKFSGVDELSEPVHGLHAVFFCFLSLQRVRGIPSVFFVHLPSFPPIKSLVVVIACRRRRRLRMQCEIADGVTAATDCDAVEHRWYLELKICAYRMRAIAAPNTMMMRWGSSARALLFAPRRWIDLSCRPFSEAAPDAAADAPADASEGKTRSQRQKQAKADAAAKAAVAKPAAPDVIGGLD